MQSLYDRMIAIEVDNNWLKEDEGYSKFVKKDLKKIISKIKSNESAKTVAFYCQKAIEYLEIRHLSYALIFFKKYGLINFVTQQAGFNAYCGISYNYKKDLSQKDILTAYEEELANIKRRKKASNKDKKISTQSIFERLDAYDTIEERQTHIRALENKYNESFRLTVQENEYNAYILDRENGLYKLLEEALYNYNCKKFILKYNPQEVNFNLLKQFCDKFGIEIKMLERGEVVSKDYLPNVKTIEDIRELFTYYFYELQRIEHFSKTKEKLWEEQNNFVASNSEWLEQKRMSR